MHPEIILIGPIGAGKTTVGTLLAETLNLPRVSLDDVRFDYYKQIGYDEAAAEELERRHGFLALYRHWKPFEAYAVERA
jgi:shikimate kinase